MKHPVKLFVVMAALLAVVSCRTGQRSARQRDAYHPLQPPAAFGGSAEWEQLLTVVRKGRTQRLRAHVTIDTNQVQIIGFTPVMAPLFVLRYDSGEVEFENRTGRRLPFEPERILSDLQLVFWPALAEARDWSVREQAGGRKVYRRNHLMTEIFFPKAGESSYEYRLVNRLHDYALTIRNLNQWPPDNRQH